MRTRLVMSAYVAFGFLVGLSAVLSSQGPLLAKLVTIPAAMAISYVIFLGQRATVRSLFPSAGGDTGAADEADEPDPMAGGAPGEPRRARLLRIVRQTFSLSGRLSERDRGEALGAGVVIIILASVVSAVAENVGVPLVGAVCRGALTLLVALAALSAAVQRMHDRGRSGWWLLVFFGPLIGVIETVHWLIDRHASEKVISLAFIIGLLLAAPTFVWGLFETAWLPPKPKDG